jgi:hypothetical protein
MLGHAQIKGYEFFKWNFNPFNVTTKIETKGSTNYWYDTNIAWMVESSTNLSLLIQKKPTKETSKFEASRHSLLIWHFNCKNDRNCTNMTLLTLLIYV